MTEWRAKAISLHFHIHEKRPGYVIHTETKNEYSLSDITTKVLVYEDRVISWFLNYGKDFQKYQDAAFVVLQIACSQIEGVEQYRRGQTSVRRSDEFFMDGVSRIFSLTEPERQQLEGVDFYKQVRCGLFHDGMTRNKVIIIPEYKHSIEFKDGEIFISPNKFFDAVYCDFANYIEILKNPKSSDDKKFQDAFVKMWEIRSRQ